MIAEAEKRLNSFIEDKAEFVAFDPMLADPFADNWRALIETVKDHPKDQLVLALHMQHTDAVEKSMAECRDHYQGAKYFIEKAFPNNPAIRSEFGYEEYLRSHRKQLKMIMFMDTFYKVADKYRSNLLAVGLSNDYIERIKTLKDELNTKVEAKNVSKRNRSVEAESRIRTLNKVWEMMKLVNRASKIVWKNNYAKYGIYKMPTAKFYNRKPKETEENNTL